MTDTQQETQEDNVVTYINVKKYDASLTFVVLWIFTLVTALMMCGLTFQFLLTGLASAETVLGVRGDGVPPALTIPLPEDIPEVGITPLPTATPEFAPTITPVQ